MTDRSYTVTLTVTEYDEVKARIATLEAGDRGLLWRAALSKALGGLKSLGDDYPGSSCQQFCTDLIDACEAMAPKIDDSTDSGDEKHGK